MKKLSEKLMEREVFRYLLFGGMTTGVNLAVFICLRCAGISVNTANLVSIMAAVVFAFFVNRFFVFGVTNRDGMQIMRELASFAGMRMGTLAIEFFGVYFLNGMLGISGFISKCLIQALVILLNYIISKFVIFRKSDFGGVANE
ncbi:MAG: GtrA family protein [Lachnospiraceae bacterium]